jgi:hypothetical protein
MKLSEEDRKKEREEGKEQRKRGWKTDKQRNST